MTVRYDEGGDVGDSDNWWGDWWSDQDTGADPGAGADPGGGGGSGTTAEEIDAAETARYLQMYKDMGLLADDATDFSALSGPIAYLPGGGTMTQADFNKLQENSGFWSGLAKPALDRLKSLFTNSTTGRVDYGRMGMAGAGLAGLLGGGAGGSGLSSLLGSLMQPQNLSVPTGYQGGIPNYTGVRQAVQGTYDPTRRPGSGGTRYFTDTTYAAPEGLAAAQAAAGTQATGLAALNANNPANQSNIPTITETVPNMGGGGDGRGDGVGPMPSEGGSGGEDGDENRYGGGSRPASEVINMLPVPDEIRSRGVAPALLGPDGTPTNRSGLGFIEGENSYSTPLPDLPIPLAKGGDVGRYLGGPTDGMADKLKASIEGEQEARLSHGEFIIPADVVGHLGNGNSDAGARRLYDMMAKIRKARTGNTKQGKQIQPEKYLPA